MHSEKKRARDEGSRSVANFAAPKTSGVMQGFEFKDNRTDKIAQRKPLESAAVNVGENADMLLETPAHSNGCACPSCNIQSVQRATPESTADVKQLTCDLGHKNHPKGPCPMPNPDEYDEKRKGQSHPQHGGDAKGRKKMYEKWDKK